LVLEVSLGFLATLLATVCGVYLGFGKDRQVDEVRSLEKTSNLLSSLSQEVSNNKSIANSNFSLLSELQAGDQEADHYVLDTFDMDAWEASQHGVIVERTDPELYRELQNLYANIDSLNEQIRRLRSEALHGTVGDTEDVGSTELTTWTMDVSYWDSEDQDVNESGLGDLIQDRCQEVKMECDSLSGKIEDEIEEINAKASKVRSQMIYYPSTDSEQKKGD